MRLVDGKNRARRVGGRRVAVGVALLLSVAACESPAPEEPFAPVIDRAGAFVLASVGGLALPIGYGSANTPASGSTLIMADTLTLQADGRARRVLALQFRPGYNPCSPSPCTVTYSRKEEVSGSWGARGFVVTLRDPFAPAVPVTSRFSLAGDTLIVTRVYNGEFAGGEWRYIRR